MRELVAGERIDLPGEVAVDFDGAPTGRALLGLGSDHRSSPSFPPIDDASRELRPAARFEGEARLRLVFAEVPPDVDRLLVVAFERAARSIARSISLRLAEAGFGVDLGDRADAAVIMAEIYRHRGGWRLAANGQGFAGGLVVLASAYGADAAWARRLGHADAAGPGVGGDRGPGPVGGTSSGSGVAVDAHHVLSNAHVVGDREGISVLVEGRPTAADLVFCDRRNDLALVRVDGTLPSVARFREGLDLHLGEDVVVLGFPLQGLLGTGPQASAGNVAALCGLGNDSTVFQFTAPIASGNSGGPILDMSGDVVGLVSSSLDLEHLRWSGGSAENVNFGIKAAVIRSFLDAFGLEVRLSARGEALGRAAVVRQMRGTIHRITSSC